MKKWEYDVTQYGFHALPSIDLTKPKSTESITQIREMGEKGWELVSVIHQNMNVVCFWKREHQRNRDAWDM